MEAGSIRGRLNRAAFFGAFAQKVEAAYLAWAHNHFGPGIITSRADGAVLGDRVTDRASIAELLAVRAENLS